MAMSNDMGVPSYYYGHMYCVYFLRMSNGQIYTGSTGELQNRVVQHENGHVTTTSKYLPVQLVGYEAYICKSDAQRREKYMKTTEGKRLFRQQYRDALGNIGSLSSAG